ncbi:MAG: hypothetical protein UV09_C0002G0016 [Candidatus Gottesmanbacteria bacterium GW2011_GWA2_42_18]|uniref:Uncharacterized protein n=1 Tax=Candidatus Gottesmanbacteria bacterium GW2011_GWA2_42_18 TaxID=1618442 RepID=A0A0G1CDW5_9BACT|nr:MAG: hypothetical protein UV09_C0002G0016 [Candidatus Gottesmanbacteria bacterium GW2011_GWA2_42_18]
MPDILPQDRTARSDRLSETNRNSGNGMSNSNLFGQNAQGD